MLALTRSTLLRSIGAAALLAPLAVPSIAAQVDNMPADKPGDVVTQFTVTDSTQVPGDTLDKGVYTIKIVNRLDDRMIVQVDHAGKLFATFLAIHAPGLPKPAAEGPVLLHSGANAKDAIRAFKFPDGTFAEFVYPKAEAVALAKANDTTIPAVDPASQGMTGNPALSPTDRKIVTLWLLTPTPVGPNDPPAGIKAERYRPNPATSQPANTQVASAKAPTPPQSRYSNPAMPAALPHTASIEPTVLFAGLLSFLCAVLLMTRRLRLSR